jgi:hypothetical protein
MPYALRSATSTLPPSGTQSSCGDSAKPHAGQAISLYFRLFGGIPSRQTSFIAAGNRYFVVKVPKTRIEVQIFTQHSVLLNSCENNEEQLFW